MKAKAKKILAGLLVVVILIPVMIQSVNAKEIRNLELIDNIARQVDGQDLKIGDILEVTYTITPKNIEITNKDVTQKDIAMIIDTSGSMKWVPGKDKEPKKGEKSRLGIMKDVSIDFVSKFQDKDDSQIALLQYSTYAAKIKELTSVKSNNVKTFKTLINNLEPGGSTNTGDGLRAAYYMIYDELDKHDKFIVLMTDGYPEAYSSVKKDKKTFYEGDAIETELDSSYLSSYTGEKLGRGDYDCYQTLSSGSYYAYDYRKESLAYAKKMAKKVRDSGIKTFIIGFGCDKKSDNEVIAEAAGGKYYYAEDEETIHRIYSEIQEKIENSIYGEAEFCERFSNNLEVLDADDLPFGLEVSDNTVSGNIPNIEYNLIGDNQYTAEPISFTIKYKVKSDGILCLGKDSSSYVKLKISDATFEYEDIRYFNPFVANVGTSIITGHGLYTNAFPYIIEKSEGIYATERVPIKLAIKIDVNSQYPDINLKINENHLQEKVKIDIWEINEDNSKTKKAAGKLDVEQGNGEKYVDVKKIGDVFERGKTYVVVYEFEPSEYDRDKIINITAVVDGEEDVLNIKLVPLPPLQ